MDGRTGAPPDVDGVFGASPHPSAMPLRLQPNGLDAKPAATSGFFTPTDNAPTRLVGLQPRFLAGGSNLSLDDSFNGSEQSYYALNHASRIRAPAPPAASRAFPSLAAASGGIFTPDEPVASTSTVPAKRQRPRSAASVDTSASEHARPNGRPVRGVPPVPKKQSAATTTTPQQDASHVRRSSRLSKEKATPGASSDLGLGSSPVKAAAQPRSRVASANTRPTKKSRAAGLAASSRSSSVDIAGSDGGFSGGPGEEWLRSVMRCFGRATACMSRYDCQGVVEAVKLLPSDQRQSWRALMLRGRAEFEGLDYKAVRPAGLCHLFEPPTRAQAEQTLSMARALGGQHLVRGTELYSTLLWHLRKPKELSFLAQDVMAAAPTSPHAWIAAGNVFSHLEDHANALKCFRRATQADADFPYSYTLAGHECVALEEWERALRFFREAIARDQRHYNAWCVPFAAMCTATDVFNAQVRHRQRLPQDRQAAPGRIPLSQGCRDQPVQRHARLRRRQRARSTPRHCEPLRASRAQVLEKLAKPKDALEEYERAVSLAPRNPAVRFKRVRIYLLLRKQDAALRDLAWLDTAAPNEYNVHFLLAKLYGLRGDKAQMILHMTSAQELEPRSAHRCAVGAAFRQGC
jgi:anaphase-promoting complex subunit 3